MTEPIGGKEGDSAAVGLGVLPRTLYHEHYFVDSSFQLPTWNPVLLSLDSYLLGMSSHNPKVVAGTLLTTDIPTKQLIMYLNRENDNNIIIQDLDDTHVFVNSQYVEYVKENVAALLETNMFERRDLDGR